MRYRDGILLIPLRLGFADQGLHSSAVTRGVTDTNWYSGHVDGHNYLSNILLKRCL